MFFRHTGCLEDAIVLNGDEKLHKHARQTMKPTLSKHQSGALPPVLLLVASLLWVGYWFLHAQHYWEDDSYIHLEYARNFFEGRGFMFNGLVSNGDTSPVWVLLLAASHLLIPDWMTAGKSLTVVTTAFALGMSFAFGKRLAHATGDSSSVLPALMVALFVFNPYFCYWAFSGMEAVFAAGYLMLLAMLLVPTRPVFRTLFGAALLLGLAPLLRPEMILLVVVASPFMLWQWAQLTQGMPSSRKLAIFALAAVLLILPLLAWSAYAMHAFGYVLPNTNAAKRAAPDSSVAMRLLSVYGMGFPGVLISLLIVPIMLWAQRSARPMPSVTTRIKAVFPVLTWPLLIWACITTVFYVINHTYVQTRYIMVAAPALTAVLFLAIRHTAPKRLFQGVVGMSLAWGILSSALLTHPFIRNKAEGDQHVAELAAYINEKLQPDQRIAVYSIGQLGYQTRNPLIDVGGITRPEASKYLWDKPEVMIRWARSQGADYYIMGDQPEPDATLVHEIQTPQIGWSLSPSFYRQVTYLRLWKLHHD